ncbi:DUF1641 domain-containing protein [Virgibacillus siamensis]|uniref:DUF1641 domain-containing protein n=1 Tax=Virgibacillus siamensis TaxID=480071 RepID=UPI000986EB7B|nr:DUF1641 domain-containing protein [Virgibacillus siamensis]
MAEPITKIKHMEIPEEKIQQDNLDEVVEAISKNKEAILQGIDLLGTLHDNGMLNMGHALVKHKEDALENVMRELNKPEYVKVMENIVQLLFLAGDLNVGEMKTIAGRLNEGLEAAGKSEQGGKTTYFDLMKALKDPDINRSITMLLSFLKGMGKQ